MIGQTSGIEKILKCSVPITQAFTIAKFGVDDDHAMLATGSSDPMIGIFQHTTQAAEEPVRIMLTGISRVVLGGTVARGDKLTSDATGKAIPVTRHTHQENLDAVYTQNATTEAASAVHTIGIAMAAGVAGDIIPVLLVQALA